MGATQTNRRLAAILSADVVGYSRLMAADEVATLAALKRHRDATFNPITAAHGGRIVKLIGDGTLVEFLSVVDAVNCAVAIQRAAATASDGGDAAIVLRIGIHLGDVIIEDDDIYGDGVNIAARLEPLAPHGGVCVSSIVHESVRGRIDVVFTDGGDARVKNIDRALHVWHWQPGETAVASESAKAVAPKSGTPATAFDARSSIAVLPFQNMSDDPEQAYFSDGISEDIITDLSKVSGLLVIARNSSFAYRGRSVDLRTVGRELGVGAVLEGSVRRVGTRVRISAQLIDAASGGHLWAERYDRDLDDVFAVQDEVTLAIVAALKIRLSPPEENRIGGGASENARARDLFLKGRSLLFGSQRDLAAFNQIVELMRQAIDIDPSLAAAYAGLAHAHTLDFQNRWTGSDNALQLAEHFADRALETDPTEPYGHYAASLVATWQKDLDRARRESEAALALNASYAAAYGIRGIVDIYGGEPLDAVPYLERAMRLDPVFAQQYLHFLGCAHLVAGNFDAAEAYLAQRVRLVPETDLTRAFLASALGHLARLDEARMVWADLMRANPDYSLERHLERLPFADPGRRELIVDGLVKAGLPA